MKWRHLDTEGDTSDLSPNWCDSSLTLINVTITDSGNYQPLATARKLTSPFWKNAAGRMYAVRVERARSELELYFLFYCDS